MTKCQESGKYTHTKPANIDMAFFSCCKRYSSSNHERWLKARISRVNVHPSYPIKPINKVFACLMLYPVISFLFEFLYQSGIFCFLRIGDQGSSDLFAFKRNNALLRYYRRPTGPNNACRNFSKPVYFSATHETEDLRRILWPSDDALWFSIKSCPHYTTNPGSLQVSFNPC